MADLLVSVIGSVTRAYTLAVLAGTRVPQTAYRIAKLADLSPPNVYVELRKLARAGIVCRKEGGWVLEQDRVRAFCEGQGPLFERTVSLERKREWRVKNRRRISQILRQPIPEVEAKKGPEPKVLREFSRSRTKNELLRAAGLSESQHRYR
jgi:DNA-binding transcriptional ArsR family regulator